MQRNGKYYVDVFDKKTKQFDPSAANTVNTGEIREGIMGEDESFSAITPLLGFDGDLTPSSFLKPIPHQLEVYYNNVDQGFAIWAEVA